MAEVRQYTPRPAPPPTERPVIAPSPSPKPSGHIWFREVWLLVVAITCLVLGAVGYHVAMMTAFPVAERTILHSMAISSAVNGGDR